MAIDLESAHWYSLVGVSFFICMGVNVLEGEARELSLFCRDGTQRLHGQRENSCFVVISAKSGASDDQSLLVLSCRRVGACRGPQWMYKLSNTVQGVQEKEAEELGERAGGKGARIVRVQSFVGYVVVGVELSEDALIACVIVFGVTMAIAPWLCYVLLRWRFVGVYHVVLRALLHR